MLGKLMKHEFRATGRVALPLCGVMLALSVVAGMALRFWNASEAVSRAVGWIGTLYGGSVFAVAVGVFAVLMQHYKRNLLGDEGYLMRTLPVSVHELLLSKLFAALCWYVAAAVLIALSAFLVGALSGELRDVRPGDLWDALRRLFSYRDASYWVFVLLGVVGALSVTTLLFYADFTLSQTFRKHRFLYHVMAVVIFIALLRLTGSLNALAGRAAVHTDIGGGVPWLGLAELYVSNAVLYVLTWAALKFRPNIE